MRDLGGLPTQAGRTRFGQLFRSMSPDRLDAQGWAHVASSGVQTVIDLRNDDEIIAGVDRPSALTVMRRPVEDQSDREFMAEWGERLGSPIYYAEILRRWPGLLAEVIRAIADAPAAVLIHCSAGRDRTGMISAIVLELVGVERASIVDDYEVGIRDYNDWLAINPARERHRSESELEAGLATSRAELANFLDRLDAEVYLRDIGVTDDQLGRIRSRLLSDKQLP